MMPKYIYLVEWGEGDWNVSFLHPKDQDNPYLHQRPKNIYKLEIDWRLLKRE